MGLELEIQKTNVEIGIIIQPTTFFYNITSSQNTFAPNLSKMDLGLKIDKINVRLKISMLTILCVSIFRQNIQC